MMHDMSHITVRQIMSLAKWCGLEVIAPAGIVLGTELQISNGQLAELLSAVNKHYTIKDLEARITTLESAAVEIKADKTHLELSLDRLKVDNDILRSRAMPQMNAPAAHSLMRALSFVMKLQSLRARLMLRKGPDLTLLHDQLKQALINTTTQKRVSDEPTNRSA